MEAQRRGGEDEEGEGEEQTPGPSVFPLFPLSSEPSPSDPPSTGGPQWLSNSSFTFDISSLPRSGSGGVHREEPDSPESDAEASGDPVDARPPPSSYGLIPSSPSGSSSEDERRLKHKERKRRKRKREKDKFDDGAPRKSGVRAWAGSNTKPAKDYYFDSHGDMDNLAFGCLYRMDIARYKIQNNSKTHGNKFWALCGWRTSASNMDIEGDQDVLDNKLKSGGRYYSVKFTTLERNKNFRNLKFVNKVIPSMIPEDFVPLSESHSSSTSVPSTNGELEESWEDEVIRRTREFNKMSRDCPNDEKVWLAFAEFQDKIASTQPQKAARLQMLEKKISILEKAVELNPNSEDLLLCLLKSYQGRDSIDTAMEKWERILMQHSDSCKLWKEFLLVCQGDFSRFRVSQIRRIYAHAIQALASACDKHRRQESASLQSADPSIVQLELGLIDIFVSYCRFEWQAGYQELATGLFQAEIEYSLFSPSLVLSSHSKQRLFEHFWKSGVARIGEDGALGWSSWLEKDEQIRQKVISEDRSSEKDVGGWSGWFQLAKRRNSTGEEHEVEKESDLDDEKASENLGSEENPDAEEIPPIDDIEALLKKMGIDIDAEPHSEVKDTETWNRWATEELLRDNEQWMPIHKNSGVTGQTTSLYSDDKIDKDDGEQLSRVILFEDVSDYLFSLSSKEAYLSLVCQFIDFYGGKISQWVNTNKSSWSERILSLEAVPETIVDDLRVVFQLVNKTQDSSHFLLETLLSHSSTSSRTNMMKLLRNAILLCLDVLPRNYVLEESLLFAEELFVSKMNSSTCSINPSRALAKSLLKKDRQDLLFCGVYARTEATFGNIDGARKIFDMALLSIDSLPMDLKKNIPLLYFWYADMEIAMSTSSSDSELCTQRAVHILSCFGGNMKYTPFNCQISPLQILKARQGFKEQIKSLRPTWARGAIEEHSIALICAASLFEILTNDWSSGIQVIEDAFSMVLPERRSQSLQLECLWLYFIKVLERHLKQLRFSRVWKAAEQGYQTYPYNPKSYRAMLRVNYLYSVSSKVRRFFDEYCKTYPSVIMYLFALSFEIGGTGSKHRIHSLFERAITNDKLQKSVLLWRCYLEYETRIAQNPSAARRIFFRAIHACPWSKRLWLDGFQKLSSVLSAKELSDLQEVMRDKELNLRTDIYEILLQDEMPA